MTCGFKQSDCAQGRAARPGFTLVEIGAALVLLVGILTAVLVVMSRAVEATVRIRGQSKAFEVARENLESLLTVTSVSDSIQTGYSEKYPEIRWELRVEPFYEPISNKMWIRAVSVAGFPDDSGQEQTVELEHWLTGLTAEQIKQILDQQKIEEEILKELYGDQDNPVEEMTKVCLQQAGLSVSSYDSFVKRQRRERLEYLTQNGFDAGYEELEAAMEEEESQFLQDLGVNFDALNECIVYLTENPQLMPASGSSSGSGPGSDSSSGSGPDSDQPTDSENQPDNPENPDQPDNPSDTPAAEKPDCPFDCDKLDPSIKPLICQMTGCCCN
jgi:type II secretory pathway pseudopilin PulG